MTTLRSLISRLRRFSDWIEAKSRTGGIKAERKGSQPKYGAAARKVLGLDKKSPSKAPAAPASRTMKQPSSSPPPSPRMSSLPSLSMEGKRLYEQAVDPSVTAETIDRFLNRVTKLAQPEMVAVAGAMGLKFAGNPAKGKVAEQIKKRILERKGSSQRAGLLDRGTSETNGVPEREWAVQGKTIESGLAAAKSAFDDLGYALKQARPDEIAKHQVAIKSLLESLAKSVGMTDPTITPSSTSSNRQQQWLQDAVEYVLAFNSKRPSENVPLSVLFHDVAAKNNVSLGDFQDGIRSLWKQGAIRLVAWTQPLYMLKDEEYALIADKEIRFYARKP